MSHPFRSVVLTPRGRSFSACFSRLASEAHCASNQDRISLNPLRKWITEKAAAEGRAIEEVAYQTRFQDIQQNKEVLSYCRRQGRSHLELIAEAFPDRQLQMWKFRSVPAHFWDNDANQREFLDWFKQTKKIERPEEWTSSATRTELLKQGGGLLKVRFNGNLEQMLRTHYPDEPWDQIFVKPRIYWSNVKNLRFRLEEIEKEKNWDSLTVKELEKAGLGYPLRLYGGLEKMLRSAFPERDFSHLRKMSKRDVEKWGDIQGLKSFITNIAEQFHIESPKDWYKVTRRQVIEAGGEGLLEYYGGLINALVVLFPSENWIPHRNKATQSPGFWSNSESVRHFLEDVKVKYNIESASDWYEKISYQTLLLEGASTGLNKYQGIAGLLQFAYPETEWPEFRKPAGYWNSNSNIKKIVRHLQKELGIRKPDEWYRVSRELVEKSGGATPLHYIGLLGMLKIAFPETKWDEKRLSLRNKKSVQFVLKRRVEELFPDSTIIEDYRHPDLCFDSSQYPMELDLFLPEEGIAFEYNGEHHYRDCPAYGPVELYAKRDAEKKDKCSKNNIKLYVIPYWWDQTLDSLRKFMSIDQFHLEKE